MTQLTVIADDFTGALDTGVQFANSNVVVKVMVAEQYTARQKPPECDILVIDAETRHLSPQAAYEKTAALARNLKASGTRALYVKTDSGLRGNIGAMICAAMAGFGESFAAFVPAFPEMNRVTVGGIQYIDGVPIDESVFGKDPFEPVQVRYVRELFSGWGVQVQEIASGIDDVIEDANNVQAGDGQPIVTIYDAQTDADLVTVLQHLQAQGRMRLLSGCAGLAAALVPQLGLVGQKHTVPQLEKSLLVVCGSLNPITKQQIAFAQATGFARFRLTSRQHGAAYFLQEEGCMWLGNVEARMKTGCPIVVDTLTEPETLLAETAEADADAAEAARAQVAARLGELLKHLLMCNASERYLVMIIGGDTLMGFLQQLPAVEIAPLCEISPGAVLFSLFGSGMDKRFMISKSGGFGSEDLLVQLENRLKGDYDEFLHA